MPYVVASQTIPILAVAPIVVVGLGSVSIAGWTPDGWMRVSVIAAYLTFFPVTVNTVRGLKSADPAAVELMRSYAASEWAVFWKLRVPSALPYLFAAFRVAATACVVGAIIGELPSSIQGGLGGAIINFNQYYVLEPENLWATNLIAAVLGIAFFLAVVSPRSSSSTGRRSSSYERPDAVVSLAGVTKTFAKGGVTALQDIDLDVGRGEFISLIGPSGCGKSTLLRVIGDLVEPTAGEVLVNGKSAQRARLDRDYGIVFQAAVLYDWRTVAKNIALPLELLGWDRARAQARVDEMLELVELTGSRSTTPGSSRVACSSGSRSRGRCRSRPRCC